MVCLDRDRGYWDKVYCIGERERDTLTLPEVCGRWPPQLLQTPDPLTPFFLLLTRVTFAPSCFTTAVFHTSANFPACDIPTSLSWKQLYPWGNTPTYCCVTFLAIAVFHASALSQEPSLSFLHSLSVSFARLHFASCLIAEGCLFNVTRAITKRKKAIYV